MKRAYLGAIALILFLFTLSSCRVKKSAPINHSDNNTESTSSKADKVVQKARSFTGTPYKLGGENMNGIDCSGLVMVSFKAAGVVLPRTCAEQNQRGNIVDKNKVRKGDLIFFSFDKAGKPGANHVGIIVSNKDGEIKFIHASTKKGVTENTLNEPYYQKGFLHCKRVL